MLRSPIREIRRWASKHPELPGMKFLSPKANLAPTQAELAGYRKAQDLAFNAAKEVASYLQPGWTEKQAADMLGTWLKDHGVESFFHYPFCWFGDRTRFRGIRHYYDYLPSKRVLHESDPFILDVAPIVNGYMCDIGYSGSLASNEELTRMESYLTQLKGLIPQLFSTCQTGGEVWKQVDALIVEAGFDNIHSQYPFSVLGHRVHRVKLDRAGPRFINFGWHSYWEFISRGVFGQLLNEDFEGDTLGLWAVEPHLGTANAGAKFEEILVVTDEGAVWLSDMAIKGAEVKDK